MKAFWTRPGSPRKIYIAFLGLSLVASGIFISQGSASAQRATPEELLAQNAPYPLASGTAEPVIATAPEVVDPTAMSMSDNGDIFISNGSKTFTIIKRLNGGELTAAESQAGNLNFYRFATDRDSLTYGGTVTIPSSPPIGWDGTELGGEEAIDADYVPTVADLYESQEEGTAWKPELQNVGAVHVDKDGVLFIGENENSFNVFASGGSRNITIGQNRLIYARPNGDTPSDGYVQFRATLFPEGIRDIASDSRGYIYVATLTGSILTYELQADALVQVGRYTHPLGFVTSVSDSPSEDLLFATVSYRPELVQGLVDSSIVLALNASNARNLTPNTSLSEDFAFLGTNCHEERYIASANSRGELIVRRGVANTTNLSGVREDEFANVFVLDSGGFPCSSIVTLTPNSVGDVTSGLLPASVVGSRNVFLRNINLPSDPDVDTITATAIDYNPGILIRSSATSTPDFEIDSSNNLIYSLASAGLSRKHGIQIISTGVAQLRKGWNLVNWGGGDDPDGSGPLRGIATASELADYISREDVISIWSFDSSAQTWTGWPTGDLDSLAEDSVLAIRMEQGGRYLPYITQDSIPQNPLIRPGWNFLIYRGPADPGPEVDCTVEEEVVASDDEEATTETTVATTTTTLPPECSYIDSPSASAGIEFPFASCLVDRDVLSENGDRISAVYWWEASAQTWTTVYYPGNPDLNPEGFTTLKDDSDGEDQTGISFDDVILVNLRSASGNAYKGAWRETC